MIFTNNKAVTITTGTVGSLIILAILFIITPFPVQAQTSAQCEGGDQHIDSLESDGDNTRYDDFYYLVDNEYLSFSQFSKQNGTVKITISNNTECNYPISLGAYSVFDNRLGTQKLRDQDYKEVPAHTARTFRVSPNQCLTEIDIFSGHAPQERHNDNRNANRLIGYTFVGNNKDIFAENDIFNGGRHDVFPDDDDDGYQQATGNFCPVNQPDQLTGSCSVSPQNPRTGQTVTWKAEASGGDGSISYSWDGDVIGNNKTVNKEYNSPGSKRATVTIQSENQSIQRTCRVTVQEPSQPRLRGSCRVSPEEADIGETVTWRMNIDSGNPPYEYDWDLENSSDERDRRRIRTEYDDTGKFDGNVRVTDDDGDSLYQSCGSVRVNESEKKKDFSVTCRPDQSSYLVGEKVTFRVNIRGELDEENLNFDWQYNDGYNFKEYDGRTTVQYVESGTKQIVVTATHNNRTRSDVCSVDIRPAGSTKGVQLDDVPYTGPEDTARTLGFFGGISLLSLAGGLLIIRRRYSSSIPVGIPDDFS